MNAETVSIDCSICLCDMEDKSKMVKTSCGHCFHTTCIDTWLNRNNTCPLCRTEAPLNRARIIQFIERMENFTVEDYNDENLHEILGLFDM